jgi:pentapeptide MXKDX repeat protein
MTKGQLMRTGMRWVRAGVLAAGMCLTAVPAVMAQAAAEDGMAKDTAMDHDAMGKDAMGHDAMGHDAMGHDAMGHDAMGPHGAFSGAEGHKAKGSFEVATVSGRSELQLGKDFAVDKGPDVYVVLSRGESGAPSGLSLGKLKQFSGEQVWAIPAGTDLSTYSHVVLWCKKYNAIMGTAPLAQGDGMMHK